MSRKHAKLMKFRGYIANFLYIIFKKKFHLKICRLRVNWVPRKGHRSKPVLSQTKTFENVYNVYISRKPLKFGVWWFLNEENRFTGSKDMTNIPKKMTIFWQKPFFRPKSFKLVFLGQNLSDLHTFFYKNVPNKTRNNNMLLLSS